MTVRDHTGRRREILLGPWQSPESHARYARVLAELAEHQGRLALQASAAGPDSAPAPSVNEVLLAFWRHAEQHYRDRDGNPTGELDNLREALRPVRRLYGPLPARQFDSAALEGLQADMVAGGRLARTTINARINRVRRVFRWATRKKLVPPDVLVSLETVPGLKRFRTAAPESAGVSPVPRETVEATLPFLPRPVAAMVQLQLLTGCRVEEILTMRECDVSRGDKVWVYQPRHHKNAWRGKPRKIFLGPRAQAVLEGFLGQDPGDYFFRPLRRARRTAVRRGSRPAKPAATGLPAGGGAAARARAGYYDRRTYRQAIVRACRRAGVPPWTPLQLRHTRATEIRRDYGLEASQCILGHEKADVTQVYAERNEAEAMRVMAEAG